MKFTKKLSLLLGATKAMQPKQNDNEQTKEGTVQTITEQEDKPIQSVLTTEEKPDNVSKQSSLWGKFKDTNENQSTKEVQSKTEQEETSIQSVLRTEEKPDNVPKKKSVWGNLKDTGEKVDNWDQLVSSNGKNVIILELNHLYIYISIQ